MYYVYVLINEKGKTYVGQTKDINKRLKDHKRGWSKYTRDRGEWKLLFTEEYSTRTEAIKRERYLKSGVGRKYIKEVISGAYRSLAQRVRQVLWRTCPPRSVAEGPRKYIKIVICKK